MMKVQQRLLAEPVVAPQLLVENVKNTGHATTASQSIMDDLQCVTYLLSLGQTLCEQIQGAADRLCQEVTTITQERALLSLGQQINASGMQYANVLVTFPVRFGSRVFGTLSVICDPLHREHMALSLPVTQLLAQTCGWLLYTLEQSAFIQVQCEQLDCSVNGPLTRREREVLGLICRGYTQQEIAHLLNIAPATVNKHQQSIYEQLGVHSKRDALLTAYKVGLFSLIDSGLSQPAKQSGS
jgi:DNA-binding CsgD family transcriptional regulator